MNFQPQVRKSNRQRLLCGDFVLFVIKYILILVYYFLDHFDWKVFKNPLNTPVLEPYF